MSKTALKGALRSDHIGRNYAKRKKDKVLIKGEFAKFKRWVMSLFGLMICLNLLIATSAEGKLLWRSSSKGIDETDVTALCVIKDSSHLIFAGTKGTIYKSTNSGKGWKGVLILKGSRKDIHFITYDPLNSDRILAATADGLYISNDRGKSWRRSFKGKDDLQREVISIAVDPEDNSNIFIGTRRGMFQSEDGGKNWSSHSSFVNKAVYSIAVDESAIYLCSIDGAYYAKKDLYTGNRTYVVTASGDEDNGDIGNSDSDNEEEIKELNHVVVYGDRAYLGTDKGIFSFDHNGRRWDRLSTEGLLTNNIKYILPTERAIFVATDKGVFFFDEKRNRWCSISSGLSSLRVTTLDVAPIQKLIFAASEGGLFKAELRAIQPKDRPSARRSLTAPAEVEPSITEIHQAAIKYAEVSPEKIAWMRNAAQNKAWLPEVSLGLDGDIERTIDLDRGSTSTPDFYIEGPKEKDWGWDVSVSWDLGELIWSDDQTNIDVRSRLMVQLRNDILDEVTKLYFERRRLQLELYAEPDMDEMKRTLKQLRLDELTANIDALTGGYLSEKLGRKR